MVSKVLKLGKYIKGHKRGLVHLITILETKFQHLVSSLLLFDESLSFVLSANVMIFLNCQI